MYKLKSEVWSDGILRILFRQPADSDLGKFLENEHTIGYVTESDAKRGVLPAAVSEGLTAIEAHILKQEVREFAARAPNPADNL